MNRLILYLALVCGVSFSAVGIKDRPSCKRKFLAITGVYESNKKHRPYRFLLAHEPFGRIGRERFFRVFDPTLKISHPELKGDFRKQDPSNYERRMREFAEDEVDSLTLAKDALNPNGDKTHIKLHLSVGDILVTDNKNNLSAYARLPVGERSLGKFKNTQEIFDDLTDTVIWKREGQVAKVFPRLSAAENLNVKGFNSENNKALHFDKHVLRMPQNETLQDFVIKMKNAQYKLNHPSDFESLREEFLRKYSEISDAKARGVLYQEYANKYAEQATRFSNSESSTALTITRIEEGGEDSSFLKKIRSIRFDSITNEMAVIDRRTNEVITYYRVHPGLIAANQELEKWGMPPAKTPFEYFLAIATK